VSKRWTPWTAERTKALKDIIAENEPSGGEAWNRVATILDEQLGHDPGTTTGGAARVKWGEIRDAPPHMQIETEDAPLPHVPVEERWQQAEEQTAKDIERHAAERHLKVRIPGDSPIGISFISDQHIRETGPIDLTRMREDAELIRETPGLYAFLGGDGVDNHIKHRAAMVASGSSPKREWEMYDHYLSIFGEDKIVAMISGNHDDWTRDFAGMDMVDRLARRHRVHYHPDEVMCKLSVDGVLYRVKMRHQYRFNSTFNLGHTIKRLWEMGDDDFDIGVVCHHHESHMETFDKHGTMRVGFRPGSYQYMSSYSRRLGFKRNTPTCPTVILWPGQHRIMPFIDVWDAADYLGYLRSR
jgi:hypothetical protein